MHTCLLIRIDFFHIKIHTFSNDMRCILSVFHYFSILVQDALAKIFIILYAFHEVNFYFIKHEAVEINLIESRREFFEPGCVDNGDFRGRKGCRADYYICLILCLYLWILRLLRYSYSSLLQFCQIEENLHFPIMLNVLLILFPFFLGTLWALNTLLLFLLWTVLILTKRS